MSQNQHERARIGGVTGDDQDPSRMAVRIENEDGSYRCHLSFAIEDLKRLAETVVDYEPALVSAWERRGGQ